jgi:hypothetical protein
VDAQLQERLNMASTNFINNSTVIVASWLNDVNALTYTVFNAANTPSTARIALGISASNTPFTSTGTIAATDVQGALVEVEASSVQKTSNVGGALLPIGLTADRDIVPIEGEIRANSELKKFEGYLDARWQDVGGGQMLGNASVKAIHYNSQTIAENLTIAAGTNGLSAGPITINDGFSVTVSNGVVWSVT